MILLVISNLEGTDRRDELSERRLSQILVMVLLMFSGVVETKGMSFSVRKSAVAGPALGKLMLSVARGTTTCQQNSLDG